MSFHISMEAIWQPSFHGEANTQKQTFYMELREPNTQDGSGQKHLAQFLIISQSSDFLPHLLHCSSPPQAVCLAE